MRFLGKYIMGVAGEAVYVCIRTCAKNRGQPHVLSPPHPKPTGPKLLSTCAEMRQDETLCPLTRTQPTTYIEESHDAIRCLFIFQRLRQCHTLMRRTTGASTHVRPFRPCPDMQGRRPQREHKTDPDALDRSGLDA